MKIIFCAIAALLSISNAQLSSKKYSGHPREKTFSDMYAQFKNVKESVIFLGTKNGKGIAHHCTGTLANISGKACIISAKHCLEGVSDTNFYGSYLSNGIVDTLNLGAMLRAKKAAVFAEQNYDIVLISLKGSGIVASKFVLNDSMFVGIENISELDEVIYVSFQPQLDTAGTMLPIVRKGFVSGFDKQGRILIDGFAFKGNSGSLSLLAPSLTRSQQEGAFLGFDDRFAYKIVGVLVELIPDFQIKVFDPTTKRDIVISGNTGLTVFEPTERLLKVLNNKDFKSFHR